MEKLPKYLKREHGDLWLTEDERDNLKISYRIQDVVFVRQSDFQHVMILHSYDFGHMLVLDGVVQTTSLDGFIYNEMISHIPLAHHRSPEKVLIIGGGDLGAAREVCKYPEVSRIDLVEIDRLVVEACRQHLPEVSGNLDDHRVRYVFADGTQFVKEYQSAYDVIIVDSSDPIGPARQLFEYDFYLNSCNALKPDGLLVCQSQSPIFHFDVMATTYSHFHRLFADVQLYTAVVPTYPGGLWSFTMGSKRKVTHRRPTVSHETNYVNQEILDRCRQLPRFLRDRLDGLRRE